MLRVILLSLVLSSSGLYASEKKLEGEITIFHAGSLSVPFQEISKEFTKIHPKVKIFRESCGSRTCARKISDLKKNCDVMGSADYKVIDNLLIPDHADWNIKFASNEMTIVYHKHSKYADTINSKNWYKILMKDDVAFGRSDPNSDPCGYRAVLTMKLAEKFYQKKGLSKRLLQKDLKYIRPKETELLALLESHEIDYIFLYRSVAKQHGLKYLLLPNKINLKQAKHTNFYKKASLKITGKKPGEFITKKGAPMVYGITIPKNSKRPDIAMEFVKFLLEKDKGQKIMSKNGQPAVFDYSETYDKIPVTLKKFATKK